MTLLKRIFGICETKPPIDSGCWHVEAGAVKVDLGRLPELKAAVGAVRFEGKGLPVRVLLVHAKDGQWRAYANRCTHMGRRLDFVPESGNLRCCSISRSLFRSSGALIDGPAKGPIEGFPVEVSDRTLTIYFEKR